KERLKTSRGIVDARGVKEQSINAGRRVGAASCVINQRINTDGGIELAVSVAIKCRGAFRSVVTTRGIECKGLKPAGRVVVAGRVGLERITSGGRITARGCIAYECASSDGRLVVVIGVLLERINAVCRVAAPAGLDLGRLCATGRVCDAVRVLKEGTHAG